VGMLPFEDLDNKFNNADVVSALKENRTIIDKLLPAKPLTLDSVPLSTIMIQYTAKKVGTSDTVTGILNNGGVTAYLSQAAGSNNPRGIYDGSSGTLTLHTTNNSGGT